MKRFLTLLRLMEKKHKWTLSDSNSSIKKSGNCFCPHALMTFACLHASRLHVYCTMMGIAMMLMLVMIKTVCKNVEVSFVFISSAGSSDVYPLLFLDWNT
jgi:hypothetical protein